MPRPRGTRPRGDCRVRRTRADRALEDRRRAREPRRAVRADPPQHRLDGPRPPGGPCRVGRPRPAARTRRRRSAGATRASISSLVKPMTYMNESGIAVRKILARERAPLPEMLVVVDDFALPFGKLRFREGGGRAATTACARSSTSSSPRSSAGSGSASGSPAAARGPRPVDVRAGGAAAPRRASRRGRRRGRGLGPRWHEQGGQPPQHVRAPAGRRRARSRRPGAVDGPPGPTASGGRRPAGGRSDRRPPSDDGCRCAGGGAWRSGGSTSAVERETAGSRRRGRRQRRAASGIDLRRRRGVEARRAPRPPAAAGAPPIAMGAGRRLPDLSALPPLLAATRRLRGAPGAARRRGRPPPASRQGPARRAHVASRTARRAISRPRSRWRPASGIVWVARDAEIGDRVAEELAAWARRSGGASRSWSRGLPSPTSGASSSPTRRPPGSRRSRPGGAGGRGSWWRASRRSSSTRSRRTTCRTSRARSSPVPASASRPSFATSSPSATPRSWRSPGGRVRAPGRHRRRLPAVGQPARPDRALR